MSKTMKDGKKRLAPRLRFPEFLGSREWKNERLGTQGGFLSSLTGKSAKDFDIGDAKFIPYMNVFANTFTDVRDLRSVDVTEGESQNAVVKGDVFFTVSSETPDEAGMSSVLLEDIDNCYLNSFCALFRFDNHRAPNPVFLGYWLRSGLVRAHLSKGAQGAIRYNISKPVFRNLPLLLPSPSEQQKIADCLSSLDALITAQADKLDALKTHKKGLMQQLFPREGETVPPLRFPEFRDKGEWKEKPLGKFTEEFREKSSTQDEYEVLTSAREGLVRQKDYYDNDRITGRDNVGFNVIPPGYLTYRSRSDDRRFFFNENNLGITGIISTYYPVFSLRDAYSKFFIYLLAHFQVKVGKYSVGTSQTVLSFNELKRIELVFPSFDEQQKIADCLSSLDVLIAAHTEKLEALKEHKKGLMQQLFPSPEAVSS